MKEHKRELTACGLWLAAFILFTAAVKLIDVRAIGPEGSEVGFAAINGLFAKWFTYNPGWYGATNFLGTLAILLGFGFAALGVYQLVTRRALKRVDSDLFVLGSFYVLMGIVYVLFEKVVVNYRPVLLEEGLEASYPSSHTVLSVFVFLSAFLQLRSRVKNELVRTFVCAACLALAAATVIGRVISGAHWISDITGGLLLSAAMVCGYCTAVAIVKDKE